LTATRSDIEYFDGVAREFGEVSAGIFGPLYREIADLVESEGHPRGRMADLGTGTGGLAAELAARSGSPVVAIDISTKMLEIARSRISSMGLSGLVEPVLADVHALPIRDSSLAAAVSRGSAPFWRDRATAFREIYRCLMAGGLMFVGGGLGMSEETRRAVKGAMGFRGRVSDLVADIFSPDAVREEVSRSGIPAEVLWGDFGLWVRARR
jgi:ubiquinone/menaquinone biosynthesis C-methylase UbiE